MKAEQNPWTSWKILNGKLLLNKDTFMIDELGPDSMYLETMQESLLSNVKYNLLSGVMCNLLPSVIV